MSFDFYFYIFRLSNVLFVNAESLLKLFSGLSNIFLKTFAHKPRPTEYFDDHVTPVDKEMSL